jgi:8-oxo-dGTP pyrophosphatase MutT (NUDIX family)
VRDSHEVRAAGGVVHRVREDGTTEVAVIRRPKYGDWTLPKGKLDEGETDEQAAMREIEEETGYRVALEGKAGSVRYRDRHGRPKIVTYFYARPESGSFSANDEVDELRWLPIGDALALLSYEHDKRLVAGLARKPRV